MKWEPQKPPHREFKKDAFAKSALVGDFIFQIGEYPELRKVSKPVANITSDEMQARFTYIKKCLKDYRKITGYGRGITGVQIGEPQRFSVIYTPEDLLIIVNPKITKRSKKKLLYPEMCMSANPIIAPTIRPAWIEFTYFDEKGKEQKWDTKDDTEIGRMMNRIFQHEIDHMDGIINIDIVKSSKDLILESDPNFYKSAKFEEVD